MSTLIDVLGRYAAPETADLDELSEFGDSLLSRIDPRDFDDGELVGRAAEQFPPEFITLAEAATRAHDPHATSLLDAAAQTIPGLSKLPFSVTADVALASPGLINTHGRNLAASLADRIEATRTTDGLQAYAYLEALTRLGFVNPTAKFRAIGTMLSVSTDDANELLERLPRLVGLAHDYWAAPELIETLELLLEHADSRTDALFELAMTKLRAALDATSMPAVLAGLVGARNTFTTVEAAEEAREDATLYRCALNVVLALATATAGTATDNAQQSLDDLTAAFRRRVAWTARPGLGGWVGPRRQAEAEWLILTRALQGAIQPLGQPSWLSPIETLDLVLAAYQASRSVTATSGEGLRLVLEPTIEATFVRREGLLGHLRAALSEDALSEHNTAPAAELLDAAEGSLAAGTEPDALGKVWAAAPDLAAELGADSNPGVAAALTRALETTPEVIEILADAAQARARARSRSADPIVDSLLANVLDGLEPCSEFQGTVAEEFTELITALLRFAADRTDVGVQSGGKANVGYLFKPEDGIPVLEVALQLDAGTWLKATPLRPAVRFEERDVAAGRADLTVTRTHRFTIEVKRELTDASRSGILMAYGGQAAAYSAAGPGISIAMVLDLTDHKGGVPALKESVWVDTVPVTGGAPRYVVTIVVRGNRVAPNKVKAPSRPPH
jgi:hypothetical protein